MTHEVEELPLQEEQGLPLYNYEEASPSANSLEKINNLNNSTTKQLENIERENRKTLWEMVQNKDTTRKEKMNAISLLMQMYDSRLLRLTAGPESFLNVKKSLSETDLLRIVDNNPLLKARVQQKKLFPKGFFNLK